MKPDRKKDFTEGYYGSLPTVRINARYKDGKFRNVDTDQEIILKNEARVKMTTLRANIREEDCDIFAKDTMLPVLPAGTRLRMIMPVKDQGEFEFLVELKEKLVFRKTGNKEAVALPCQCRVVHRTENGYIKNAIKFEPFDVDSLNQAFFQASVRYRPDNKSHTANIYQILSLENGRKLDELRF